MTTLPSPTAFFVAWAAANTALAALVGPRIGTRLDATMPAIRVQRIGGTPSEPWRDDPALQVECWAADEGVAEKIALTLVDELPKIRSVFTGGRCYSYIVDNLFFSTDAPGLSSNVRYILTVRLLVTK